MTEPQKIPTPDEVRARCAKTREFILNSMLNLDTTIEDYPIGRCERGKCRLQVERDKKKGFRTVKTTTNKFGRWCTPKKSTFTDTAICVIDLADRQTFALHIEYDQGWLYVGPQAVSMTYANGSQSILVRAPHHCKPQREPRHVTWSKHAMMISRAGLQSTGEPEITTDVIPADPPELCDAYDVWMLEYHELRKLVTAVWDAAVPAIA
jgi:hypothetical protein